MSGGGESQEHDRWRLAALESVLDDAVVFAVPDGRIASWSLGAERLYGYGRREVLGLPVTLTVPPDARTDFQDNVSQVLGGGDTRTYEAVRRTRSGDDVEVEERLSPVVDPGRGIVGVQIIGHPLTESKRLAAALDATVEMLDAALIEARATEERGRAFLADAAHQLRSPITTIRVCTETLLQGVEAAEQDRLLADLVRQTARAGRLLGSLLRIARLDEGEELTLRPCDLVALCQDEADRMWHLAPHLDVVLKANERPEDAPKVDEGAVREILANLLENAIRYAESQVELRIDGRAEEVTIEVRDDGPGLAAGAEERAFQRFVTIGEKGGSGLGLPIARELARAHGGDLTYESGAFVVRVPAAGSAP